MSLDLFFTQSPHPYTGFGDDPNWSVKFHILVDGEFAPDWESGLRMATQTPATGNGEITQRRGRDPWQISFRLWLSGTEDLERLDAMLGRRATLRYGWGVTKTLGLPSETIMDAQYHKLPGTMLLSLDKVAIEGDGTLEVTATFSRPYVDPAAFVPPVWPPAPYPGVRYLPDPLLFLTQPFSRNAAGSISPASGAARPTTMSSYGAWRLIPAAKNGVYNPLFSGMTNWTAELGATLTANGDGTARVQTSAIYQGITTAPGTALAAVQGETVTIVVSARSRTVTRTMDLQFYAHSANNHGGNTSDLTKTTVSVTTSWQRFSFTRTLTDPASQFVFLRFTSPDSTARDLDIKEPMVFKGSTIPEAIPAVVGGVLLVGDTWDSTANASPSTRTAGSLSASLASFGSLYVRWSADGTTVTNTVLTAPGSLGSSGTVAYSGGVLTITSPNQLWLGAVIAYPGTLSPSQKTYLDSVATSALTWTM